MLTDRAVAHLRPLVYRETAQRIISLLPLGGIYWDDEIPDLDELYRLPDSDREGIIHLSRIRPRLWAGDVLSVEDQSLWDTAREQVPGYALFHRTEPSEDDRRAQWRAEEELEEICNALLEGADEVEFSGKGGLRQVSGKFDLTKGRPPRAKSE